MNGPAIFSSVTADIEHRLHDHHSHLSASVPKSLSPGLAAALLQKSIRRGRTDLALTAANTLLATAPDRLWRRLCVIAIEDVGLGGPAQVYETVVAAANCRRLARRFGASRLANLIVSRLAAASKCRGADDLFVVTADCPAWDRCHIELAEMPTRDLLDVVAGDEKLERRAIALRLAMGAETMAAAGRPRGRHRLEAVFDFLCEITPHSLAEIAREAFRQTHEPFTAFLPILHSEFEGARTELRSDDFPPETIIGGLPGWALDGFSREGRAALSRFLDTDCSTAHWLRLHIPPRDRMPVLRHAQFRVEAGLVADRLTWAGGEELRRQADLHSWPFPSEEAVTLLALMRDDIDTLNHIREQTYGR